MVVWKGIAVGGGMVVRRGNGDPEGNFASIFWIDGFFFSL